MITGLVLGLLADLVFESAVSRRRTLAKEMQRYLECRGLVAARQSTRAAMR